MNVLILLALAFAPGLAIGLYIYLKDHHEREPLGLLLTSFIYGGLSTFITFFISWPLDSMLTLHDESVIDQFTNAFLRWRW